MKVESPNGNINQPQLVTLNPKDTEDMVNQQSSTINNQARTENLPHFPMTCLSFKTKYCDSAQKGDYLSNVEETEIDEFETIYYCSQKSKKYQPTKLERLVNNGFDDNEGYYRVVSGDHIGYRYEIYEIIGKGAFGQVIKCFDHKQNEYVAIKLVKN